MSSRVAFSALVLTFAALASPADPLRIGTITIQTGDVLRVDFAYALQPDSLGRRGLLVSFSSGQAF